MKGLKAIDQLYKQYSLDRFQGISTEGIEDQDLKEFILEVQTKGPRFSNYDPETLENYAANIYELRKNQSNNSAR